MSDEQAEADQVAAAHAEQRTHLRRILVCFAVVVVLLPLAGLGDTLGLLLLPMLAVAAYGLREAVRLRRSVRRYGPITR